MSSMIGAEILVTRQFFYINRMVRIVVNDYPYLISLLSPRMTMFFPTFACNHGSGSVMLISSSLDFSLVFHNLSSSSSNFCLCLLSVWRLFSGSSS